MAKIFKSKLVQTLIFIVLVATLIFIYLYGLKISPVHLNQDEMAFGLSAHSIAKTGRDLQGNLYPFYFWQLGMLWSTPVIVYTTSLFLKFLPFTEASIRVPGAVMALVSILGLGLIAKQIFKDRFYFILAIIIGGATPALFINSRLAMDVAWPIIFVVFWLFTLKLFESKEKPIFLILSGLILGFGIHSYHAAVVTMPIYFAITIIYLFITRQAKFINIFAISIGFALPILVFIPWLKVHPDTLLNQVSYVGSIDKSVDTTKGIWGVFNINRLTDFASNYLTYFSPKILFVEGDRSLIHSTGRVGAFSFSVAFLLLFGIVETLKRKEDFFSKLILFGFLTYPVAPSIVNDPQRISRGLVVIPFVILLCIYGIAFLRSQKDKVFKYVLAVILAFILIDFGLFLSDYFGNYRLRSSGWFNNNIGGLYESVIKSSNIRKVDRIYIDKNIYFAEDYFNFYQIQFGQNLKNKVVYIDTRFVDFSKIPKYSLVATQVSDIPEKPNKIGGFEKIETIRELNGYETFLVYYKD